MPAIRRIPVILLTLGIASCTQFPTRYDRIEPDALRSTGFTYAPYAEGAPGDTIHVRAYFPGLGAASVSWQMSYSRVFDVYAGADTVLDVFDLPLLKSAPALPDSADITFAVPESTFFHTKGIPAQFLSRLRQGLPQGMRNMSQKDFAALLQDFCSISFSSATSLSAFLQRWGPAMGVSGGDPASLERMQTIAGAVLYAFSVPAVLYATITASNGKKLRVMGEFTIRYNRRFQNTPLAAFLPVNRNPALRWIGLYTVKGSNVEKFSPSDPNYDGRYAFSYLYNEYFPDSVRDTVAIDTGYSYFLAADSGIYWYPLRAADSIRGRDTAWKTIPADSLARDTILDKIYYDTTFEFETMFFDWQYQNIAVDSTTKPADSLLFLSPGSSEGGGWEPSIMRMLPSVDAKMTHARIWVTEFDYASGALNRPSGFAIRNVDVFFTYSDAYKSRH